MEAIFRSFCAFGDKGAAPLMDGAKFAKFFRDLKLLDKNVTTTDVDIIFSKVKTKTERKITYKQFQEALKLVAEKKYPAQEDALEKIQSKILEGKGPTLHATKTVKSGAVERLTETKHYTGTHKERFDESGQGKGIAGREDTATNTGYVTGFKGSEAQPEKSN